MIFLRSDIIHGIATVDGSALLDMKKIVVTPDNRSHSSTVLIGVNARDRPGLLLDISKCLLRLKFQVHRTEAAVHDMSNRFQFGDAVTLKTKNLTRSEFRQC